MADHREESERNRIERVAKAYITIAIRLYDTTTIRLRRKIDMFIFACVELEAGARDTS